ncbi:hypothetical protein VNI00_007762 [Paramarasmius palmivorus]|uniref:Uncharacterized protein n=1 Tax=Paramarasmius palmivorus TaxID=297713 RepID=A0AAW0CV86_9AGAR
MVLKKVSWSMRHEVSQYEKTVFGLEALYGTFFEKPEDIEAFRVYQAKSEALVSGSALVRVLSRGEFDPSDLDVFVNLVYVLGLGDLLRRFGFRFVPFSTVFDGRRRKSVQQDPDFKKAVQAEFSSRSPNTGTVAERYDDYTIAGVFNFENDDHRRIQIVATRHEPIEAILGFYSTLVMNVATATQIISLYPSTSFVRRWALYLKPYSWAVVRARMKYELRGWRPWDLVTAEQAVALDSELSIKTRWIGDRHCWVVDLPPMATYNPPAGSYRSLMTTSWNLRYPASTGARLVVNRMSSVCAPRSHVITWEAERSVWNHPCFALLHGESGERVVKVTVTSEEESDFPSDESTDGSVDGGEGDSSELSPGDEESTDGSDSASDSSEDESDEGDSVARVSLAVGMRKWKYVHEVAECVHREVVDLASLDGAVVEYLHGLYPHIHASEKADAVLIAMQRAFGGLVKEFPCLASNARLPMAHVVTVILDCMLTVEYVCMCDDVRLAMDFEVDVSNRSVWTKCTVFVPMAKLAEVKQEIEEWSDDNFKHARLTLRLEGDS